MNRGFAEAEFTCEVLIGNLLGESSAAPILAHAADQPFASQIGILALFILSVTGWIWHQWGLKRQLRAERLANALRLEQERRRIAQELHDDLGAHLTRIGFLAGTAKHSLHEPSRAAGYLEKISTTSRTLITNMSEIVWATNPKNDSFSNLVSYLRRYAADFLDTAGIKCCLDFPAQPKDFPINAADRRNLLLILKETLHNAVKHGEATVVRARLHLDESHCLTLAIDDNGCGFELNQPTAEERGLTHLRNRAVELGGKLQITSIPNGGTSVSLWVPHFGQSKDHGGLDRYHDESAKRAQRRKKTRRESNASLIQRAIPFHVE